MSNKATLYTHQCLAGAGFAVINSQIAWRLRPDLFATGEDCAAEMRKRVEADGVVKLVATIEDVGDCRVLARSARNLAQRIEDVVGFKVTAISEYAEPAMIQVTARTVDPRDAQLAKLRALAAQDLPAHECHARREILAARAELARID